MSERVVTLGLHTVGHVHQCGDRWEAFNATGEALGAFAKAEKAVGAVLDAAQQRERER